MRHTPLAAIALLAAMPAPLGAQGQGDQVLTTREDAAQLTGWGFDQADTNKDGVLTWKEWERKFETQIAADADITPKEADLLKADARGFFRLVDADKDKNISRAELIGWYDKLFVCNDENRDDVLMAAELERNSFRCNIAMGLSIAAPQPTTQVVQPQPGPVPDGPSAPIQREELLKATEGEFDRSDTDRDGYLNPAEMQASDEQGDPADPKLFRAFDKDTDGRISKPEFVGMALGLFDCMDSNHDGQATLDERQKAAVQCLAAEGLEL